MELRRGFSSYVPAVVPSGPRARCQTRPVVISSSGWSATSEFRMRSYAGRWFRSIPLASTVSSISGMMHAGSFSSSYSSNSSGSGLSEILGGLMDVPHLLSIKPSNIFRFSILVGELISSGLRGHEVRRGTCFPLALRIHCAISFPAPLAGPRTLPRTSRLKGNFSFCSREYHHSYQSY
jgi:hypothetical protein